MTPEILAPAGSVEALRAAFLAGADAVYIGGERFGARAYADNPDDDTLLACIELAHRLDKKLYLTVNTLIKEREMEDLVSWLAPFYDSGLDAAIVQDLGVFSVLRRAYPELPLHLSTQMAVTGACGAALLEQAGARRVIPARELSLPEIREIRKTTGLEIECFVHGAMCYSYSGRCLMSSLIGGRSGNRGRCAGICRLPFSEGGRTRGREEYPLSMKDLCAIDHLSELLDAGVTSFKIEGRMKRPAYTAEVVRLYRKYLDRCLSGDSGVRAEPSDKKRLLALFNRDGFTSGYYHQKNGREMIALENEKQQESRSQQAQEIYAEVEQQLEKRERAGGLQSAVRGTLTVRPGEPLQLEMAAEIADEVFRVRATGAEVQRAERQPLTKERLLRQMQKTGGAPYRFLELEIRMAGDAFLPISEINAVRRRAFERMDASLREHFARRREGTVPPAGKELSPDGAQPPELWATVENAEQFHAIRDIRGLAGIYVPIDLLAGETTLFAADREDGVRICAALPQVVRGGQAARIREMAEKISRDFEGVGFLARDLEGLAVLMEGISPDRLIADAELYTMNRAARDYFGGKVFRATAPLELNAHELSERGCAGDEVVVYGRAPLMISAQCVQKTGHGCDRAGRVLELVDRKGARFPVVCSCHFCYNTIYNSLPTSLLGDLPAVCSLKPAVLRMDFTVESGREAAEVVRQFARSLLQKQTGTLPQKTTRGHFHRGAE